MRKTVASTEAIYEKRSILLSEVLRLKSLLFSLENERLGLMNQISEIEHGMDILLRDTSGSASYFVPQLDRNAIDSLQVENIPLQDVFAAALEKRPDYRNSETQIQYEETNLSLQKAMRIPDITVGGTYSRAGNYIPDYYALTLSVDLPIFNRNQGNIEISKNTLEADKVLHEYSRKTLEKEIATAYRKAVDTDSLFRAFDKKFTGEVQNVGRWNGCRLSKAKYYHHRVHGFLRVIQNKHAADESTAKRTARRLRRIELCSRNEFDQPVS